MSTPQVAPVAHPAVTAGPLSAGAQKDASEGRTHVVVTGAKSRTHLVYVASYVRSLLEAGGSVHVSIVEVPAFLAAPEVTLEDARDLMPRDAELTLESGVPGWRFRAGARAVYVAVGAPGLKAGAALRRANPKRRIECVVTDEGIGTYGSFASRREAIARQGVSPARAAVRAALVQSSARLLTTRRWPAYEQEHGSWRANAVVAHEFTRDLAGVEPGQRDVAVILTQPFPDLGLIDEGAYLTYVRSLAAAARSAGLRPLVRPHPAEVSGRYDEFDVMSGRGTAELDEQVVSATLVMGGPSTAMINLSAMSGMPVVWASEPSLAYLDSAVSRNQAGIFAAFLGEPCPMGEVSARVGALVAGRGSGTG